MTGQIKQANVTHLIQHCSMKVTLPITYTWWPPFDVLLDWWLAGLLAWPGSASAWAAGRLAWPGAGLLPLLLLGLACARLCLLYSPVLLCVRNPTAARCRCAGLLVRLAYAGTCACALRLLRPMPCTKTPALETERTNGKNRSTRKSELETSTIKSSLKTQRFGTKLEP